MKRTAQGHGVYLGADAAYYARPTINGRRTWRRLAATKLKEAVREANNTAWLPKADTFGHLAEAYLAAGCPNRRMEQRQPGHNLDQERMRSARLVRYFGTMDPSEIRVSSLPAHRDWCVKAGHGAGPTMEAEWKTLSNILNYGVMSGVIPMNWCRSGRPRVTRSEDVRHCRECAPADGNELNRLIDHAFSNPRSEATGWQLLFEAMTGVRTNEALRLRMDAAKQGEPGYLDGNYLWLERSKNGVNPFALIHPDLEEFIRCHHNWHRERCPDSPCWFPGYGGRPLQTTVATTWLRKACKRLGLPQRTSHGMRSFYVTLRRSQGASDIQIAAEIGDKTVALISQTYGDRPPNWTGGQVLSWRPSEGLPAWSRWAPVESKIIQMAAS